MNRESFRLNRRKTVQILGAGGASLLAGCAGSESTESSTSGVQFTAPQTSFSFEYEREAKQLHVFVDSGEVITPTNTRMLVWGQDDSESMMFETNSFAALYSGELIKPIVQGNTIGMSEPGEYEPTHSVSLVWLPPERGDSNASPVVMQRFTPSSQPPTEQDPN